MSAGRKASASLLVLAVSVAAGCGGSSDDGAPRDMTVSVWADQRLRAALPSEIGSMKLRPVFATSEALTTRLSRRERPGVLLVDGETFPTWDIGTDRLAGSRVVARDRLVFVTRRPRTAPAAVGPGGARRVAFPRRGVAGRLAAALVRRARQRDAAPDEIEVADSDGVLQSLRDNPTFAGLALRSAVRRSKDRDRWNVKEAKGVGITEIFVQAAYAQERPEAAPVVRWLGGPEARKRFAALGLDGPGPNATVRDCTRDAC